MALLAATLAGITSLSAQENSVVTHTIDPLLQKRTTCLNPNYYVSMPEGHNGEKVPLMNYLHGGVGSGEKIDVMAKQLAAVPVYAFAGEKDDVVSPENSKTHV